MEVNGETRTAELSLSYGLAVALLFEERCPDHRFSVRRSSAAAFIFFPNIISSVLV